MESYYINQKAKNKFWFVVIVLRNYQNGNKKFMIKKNIKNIYKDGIFI